VSKRSDVLDRMRECGVADDIYALARLLAENRIGSAAAMKAFREGQL
jgi:hypothetical protein